jgi:hypothetical protein
VLQIVKEERYVIHALKGRDGGRKEGRKEGSKASWIGHILRGSDLVNLIIEGKIQGRREVNGRRGTRRKLLLDDINETRGHWKLNEETLDRTVCRTYFERGYGPVVRQTTL